jgi:hypothetical protein
MAMPPAATFRRQRHSPFGYVNQTRLPIRPLTTVSLTLEASTPIRMAAAAANTAPGRTAHSGRLRKSSLEAYQTS